MNIIFSALTVVAVFVIILVLAGRKKVEESRDHTDETDVAKPARPERRVSLITEAVAYVGTILILAGGVTAIGQKWESISAWGHLGIVAGASLGFLAVGAIAYKSQEPAFQRMVSVVWMLASGGAAATIGLFCNDVRDYSSDATTLLVGLVVTVMGAVLWRLRKTPLQQLVLFVGLMTLIISLVGQPAGDPNPLVMAFVLWGFCLIWAASGWFGLMQPSWVAVPVGAAAALMVLPDAVNSYGWMHLVGIGTAAAFMVLSVTKKDTVLLGIGAIGLFAYLTAAVIRYFGDALGVSAALAITGVLILAIAAVTARLLKATRAESPRPPDHETLPKAS